MTGFLILLFCAAVPVPGREGDLAFVVDAESAAADGTVVDGYLTFRTVGAALAADAPDRTGRLTLHIKPGTYREKVVVSRPNVSLIGEDRDATIIVWDDAAGKPGPDGQRLGTRHSYTLRVRAPGFRAYNLTVVNDFDYPANAALPPDDPAFVDAAQAVALLLDGSNDEAVFVNCRLIGYQDTLFADAGRSYFRNSTIIGHVDFIFGGGTAVFDACDIISRDRGSTTNNGYITAPSTPHEKLFGLVFIDSRLLKEHPEMAPKSVALGRPWHPSSNPDVNPAALFIDTFMDDHITETGWTSMSGNEPGNARFFESGSDGPGARTHAERRVITENERAHLSLSHILGGWNPQVD